MVHLDVKKVGRIPDGGGHRVHGRGSDQHRATDRAKTKGAKAGYVFLHSIVDGYSRLAYTEHLADEKASTTIAFYSRARAFFKAHGIDKVVRIITDNGSNYRAKYFARSSPPPHPGISTSGPTRPATTAKSNATTGSSPPSCSTPESGPQKPTAPPRSTGGTFTTTTIETTLPSGTGPQPHGSRPASPTS